MDLTVEQKLESLENQIKQLKEELYKQQEQDDKKKWWIPKDGEEYWFLDASKYLDSTHWKNNSYDNYRFSLGNAFKTEEQGKREAFERQLRFKLKKFAYENDEEEIDWDNENQRKYSIYYKTKSNELDWDYNFTGNHYGIIHFTSEDVVKKAIETFKDDLIRYFTTDK